jgi:hypothetical protein
MSDRMTTETTTRPAPNPHDTAMAVFRPEIYGEAADWLEQTEPGLFANNPGYGVAVQKLRARQADAALAPGAGLLDHASAAYARSFADRLEATGYTGAATLLRHVADDYDGGTDAQ